MKNIISIILASASTLAISAETYEVAPVYINLNTGIATGYSFATTSDSGKVSGAATNNYSLGLNAGYNFNQNFALEAGYNHLWLPSNPTNSSGQVGVEDVAAKGTIPLGNIFSLYGRLGVAGYQDTHGSKGSGFANNMGTLYGIGAQWALDKNWALRVEDWSVTGLGKDILQFGAQLSF